MDALELPSVWFVASCLWDWVELCSLDIALIWHAKIELILFDKPSWTVFTWLAFVNGEHGEPANFGSGGDFTTLSAPVEPLSVSILKGIVHVLLLVWVLDHDELLRMFVSLGHGLLISYLRQDCFVNLLVEESDLFALLHVFKDMSELCLVFAGFRICFSIWIRNLLGLFYFLLVCLLNLMLFLMLF